MVLAPALIVRGWEPRLPTAGGSPPPMTGNARNEDDPVKVYVEGTADILPSTVISWAVMEIVTSFVGAYRKSVRFENLL